MTQERALKFDELIKHELGKILFEFLETEPGVLVTITRVATDSDLFHGDVFVSVYPAEKAGGIMEKLTRSVYQIQQMLNKRLRVRPVPKIRFIYDKNPEEAAEVEELLKEIKK